MGLGCRRFGGDEDGSGGLVGSAAADPAERYGLITLFFTLGLIPFFKSNYSNINIKTYDKVGKLYVIRIWKKS